ncbi:MAG TPA: response regulator [Bacteroidota bacterium]|nr:response regulator [Bacteroidota bacterium]
MKTILVVDDEESIRSAIVQGLRLQGFAALEADNGIDAFNLAKTQSPDLIISDVMMSTGSGFVLREFLGNDDRTSNIPLIMMTGHVQSAGAWGVDSSVEYLEKPFSIDDLLVAVERKLGLVVRS